MSVDDNKKYAIRFGLGAIKAVGIKMMENAVINRQDNGRFIDIYDFAERLDPKAINKKTIEALAKSGAFDDIEKNRRKVAESFDILSGYANEKKEQSESNQMSLFDNISEIDQKPKLKEIQDWDKINRLQYEFEAFGFFLNEHPIDDYIEQLKKRGIIFSNKISNSDLEDNILVKISGVVCVSKHRSGSRGRFAYLTISDPYGIFEATIFDEALINSARDILTSGTLVVLTCLIKKDDGGSKILIREVAKLEDFIKNNEANKENFEDIKKLPASRKSKKNINDPIDIKYNPKENHGNDLTTKPVKKIIKNIDIIIKDRDPIIPLKSILSQNLSFNEEDNSRVIISVLTNGKFSKIELGKRYLLDQNDVIKIKAIKSVIDVESC